MIRYKDKTFEEYSICPATGDIFNAKTGEVQKTYMIQCRPVFKGMTVHRIMAHTYLGYKPGFEVHHLDENKFNNALSNLVYLTGAEHRRLHHEGKHYSEETRAKLSLAFKGRHLSEETRVKMSLAHKGRHLSEETRAKISAAIKNRRKN